MRIKIILLLLFSSDRFLIAQSASLLPGARAQAMGYASSCLSDEWSVVNNPGGLVAVKQLTASFTHLSRPAAPFLNTTAATISAPMWTGAAGICVTNFGDELYRESGIHAAYASTFGIASLGIRASYMQYTAQGFGRKGLASISLGGMARLTPLLSIGAHIQNLLQPLVDSKYGERLPTRLFAGIALAPSEKVIVTSELEKDIEYPAVWKTGIEYTFHKKLIFRTGFDINPDAGFAGVAFKPHAFRLDYTFGYTAGFMASHQATVTCLLKRKKA